jgi:hypothetical protein
VLGAGGAARAVPGAATRGFAPIHSSIGPRLKAEVGGAVRRAIRPAGFAARCSLRRRLQLVVNTTTSAWRASRRSRSTSAARADPGHGPRLCAPGTPLIARPRACAAGWARMPLHQAVPGFEVVREAAADASPRRGARQHDGACLVLGPPARSPGKSTVALSAGHGVDLRCRPRRPRPLPRGEAALLVRRPSGNGRHGAVDRVSCRHAPFTTVRRRHASPAIIHPLVRSARRCSVRLPPGRRIALLDIPLLF